MLKILIKGIKDGEYDIEISSPTEEIEGIFPEFFGNVSFVGKLRILGKRFTVVGKATCNAHLICDLSMEDYIEQIEVEIRSSFLANNELYYSMAGISEELRESEEHIIHEDDKYIDLTEDIRQELALGLPMKRIAPKYRDKSFDDIYPQYSANKFVESKHQKKRKNQQIDERWSVLKKLKLN